MSDEDEGNEQVILPRVIATRQLSDDGWLRFEEKSEETDVVRPIAEGLACYYTMHDGDVECLVDRALLQESDTTEDELHELALRFFYAKALEHIEMYGEPGKTGAMLTLGLGEATFGGSLILPPQIWIDLRAQVEQDLRMALFGQDGVLVFGTHVETGEAFVMEQLKGVIERGEQPLSPWLYRREGDLWLPIKRLIESA